MDKLITAAVAAAALVTPVTVQATEKERQLELCNLALERFGAPTMDRFDAAYEDNWGPDVWTSRHSLCEIDGPDIRNLSYKDTFFVKDHFWGVGTKEFFEKLLKESEDAAETIQGRIDSLRREVSILQERQSILESNIRDVAKRLQAERHDRAKEQAFIQEGIRRALAE